jgi:hypothetical protein
MRRRYRPFNSVTSSQDTHRLRWVKDRSHGYTGNLYPGGEQR